MSVSAFLVLLAAFVDCVYGLSLRERHTHLTYDQYTARYGRLAIPPTASDISLYVQGSWVEEREILISFTVPDEKTFVDWVTPLWGQPSDSSREESVVAFEGDRLCLVTLRHHLRAGHCFRAPPYCSSALYDRTSRRVYIHRTRIFAPPD